MAWLSLVNQYIYIYISEYGLLEEYKPFRMLHLRSSSRVHTSIRPPQSVDPSTKTVLQQVASDSTGFSCTYRRYDMIKQGYQYDYQLFRDVYIPI